MINEIYDKLKIVKRFHDLPLTNINFDIRNLALSIIFKDYDESQGHSIYKLTFYKVIKINFDEFNVINNIEENDPEIFSLDLKEIEQDLYEANLRILTSFSSGDFFIRFLFKDLDVENINDKK